MPTTAADSPLHRFAEIALPLPLPRPLHYRIPEGMVGRLAIGDRVLVPFRRGQEIGYCVGFVPFPEVDPAKVKEVARRLDEAPIVGEKLLALTRWIAEYYGCSWGEGIEAALPAGVRKVAARRTVSYLRLLLPPEETRTRFLSDVDVKPPTERVIRYLLEAGEAVPLADAMGRLALSISPFRTLAKRGALAIERRKVESDPYRDAPIPHHPPPVLNAEQAAALAAIGAAVDSAAFKVFLLFGVTGSGKTEVYLQAIGRVVARGAQAIVLVPEIALTPQTVGRFRARFERVAVLHSHLTEVQRGDEWRRIQSGEAQVIVGARSAIFAPCRRLGLIVVDEEHEPSFKQGNTPRYHARDVAVVRGKLESAAVILGSATPALESWHNAQTGKYALLSLPRRVEDRPLPPVEVADMTCEHRGAVGTPFLSHRLEAYARQAMAAGEQAIFFLNRRGHATVITCPKCNYAHRCARCSVALVFHKRAHIALCHQCGWETRPPTVCPECKGTNLQYLGLGTERIEETLKQLFGDAAVERMDSDSMRTRSAYDRVLGGLLTGDVDFVVGTQMVAKGLDFPNVTVVGVIAGDAALFHEDFRAAERTFQLITQVAGRAGRGEKGGRVVVQVMNPQHFSIRRAVAHDYEGFATEELAHRREFGYPPYGRLARVLVQAKVEAAAQAGAERLAALLRGPAAAAKAEVLGPAPCSIAVIKGRARWHVLVKAANAAALAAVLAGARAELRGELKGLRGVEVALDVDPVSIL
ncbi:MAG: primosomal protein N' [Planctomycetes bacterium]|nr:primosomal protein N' [Planctomycetota bacterium]